MLVFFMGLWVFKVNLEFEILKYKFYFISYIFVDFFYVYVDEIGFEKIVIYNNNNGYYFWRV